MGVGIWVYVEVEREAAGLGSVGSVLLELHKFPACYCGVWCVIGRFVFMTFDMMKI